MTPWLVATGALTVGLVAMCVGAARVESVESRLAALNGASTLAVVTLLVVGAAFDRSAFADLAIVLAVLSFIGNLAFARFLERWL